jgi:uncharacterized protein (TIGR00730 family)
MNVCVFCGSGTGTLPVFTAAAKELGQLIAKSKSTLVYGGGNIGLMGIIADEVLASQGKVIGVIPEFLMNLEVGHKGITQLEVVDSMHQRKKRMAELADAFIAMPGGWGTLDELAEILTWKQLGLINQPVGILNVNSFFDFLMSQMKKMADEGFLKHQSLSEIKIADNPKMLLTSLGVNAFY